MQGPDKKMLDVPFINHQFYMGTNAFMFSFANFSKLVGIFYIFGVADN